MARRAVRRATQRQTAGGSVPVRRATQRQTAGGSANPHRSPSVLLIFL
jgi:hypothetical protein